ncbi:MAG TPA: hypothetical protein VH165_03860, partial [Kofleriaceae bacterium]|nr:hypothetical protein [Kofleriaceae bacterium]
MRISIVAVLLASACSLHHPSSGDDDDTPPGSCMQACGDGCPADQTCSAGFCAAAGQTCEPVFEHVSAGAGFGCALDSLHRLWCWGDNTYHQIDSSSDVQITRAKVVGDRLWDSVVAGNGDVCALASGELWCWGNNARNQIQAGLGASTATPTKITVTGGPATWSFVAPAFQHTCAIGDGRLFCWGGNDFGVLGSGDVNDAFPFEVDPSIQDWTAVSTASGHTCAVSTLHGVACWGDGSSGELGIGVADVDYDPQPIGQLGTTALSTGLDTTCAITSGRTLSCWGRAADGALGDPTVVDPTAGPKLSPVPATALFGWTQIAAAEHYTCGLRGEEVWCWGSALTGGIGDGHWAPARTWLKVADQATDLSVGWNMTLLDRAFDTANLDLSCAIIAGKIQCWGDARDGQLGGGGATSARVPAEITGGHTWTSLTAGPAHVCGISGGMTYCWGSTERGQISGVATGKAVACMRGLPCDAGAPAPVVAGTTALALGGGHTCALRGAALTCWGDSTSGQCGTTSTVALAPADVPGTWSNVFAGTNGSCGVQAGQTFCWGSVLTQHAPAHEPALDGITGLALGAA